jgi:muramoyltetrapeptide carboxypeptidase
MLLAIMNYMKSNRRTFLLSLPVAGIMSTQIRGTMSVAAESPNMSLKPKAIKPGDTVGLVCPGSPVEPELVTKTTAYFESKGYRYKLGKSISEEYLCELSGTDEQRIEDLNAMISDDTVDAVVTLRGGYGTNRILPYINYDTLKANPKWVTGYSDITGLHLALFRNTGMLTLHGPAVAFDFGQGTASPALEQSFWDTVEGRIQQKQNILSRYPSWLSYTKTETWVEGKAQGILVGGNLSRLSSLAGTPYAVPPDVDIILFIEDVDEAGYRVDRMITQLRDSGVFDRVKGILVGQHIPPEDDQKEAPIIQRVLKDQLMKHGVPVLAHVPIGHHDYNLSVVHGALVEMDAGQHSIQYLEPITS